MYPILIRQLTADEAKIFILIRAPVSPNQHILGVKSVKEQKPAKHLDLHGAFTLLDPSVGDCQGCFLLSLMTGSL